MFTTTTWRGGEKWQKSLNFLKFALLMRTPVRVRVCSRGEEAFAWHILEAFLNTSLRRPAILFSHSLSACFVFAQQRTKCRQVPMNAWLSTPRAKP